MINKSIIFLILLEKPEIAREADAGRCERGIRNEQGVICDL